MRVCRVQPDVPAVARAFDYVVPSELAPVVEVGTIVRVRLHGRSVRGWVVADGVEPEADPDRLVPLRAVASAGPPSAVVALCQWVAWRWAGPVSHVLRAASPPNVVAPGPAPETEVGVYPAPPVSELIARDERVHALSWPPAADLGDLLPLLLSSEGSTIVVVPEPARAGALRASIARYGREVVELHAGMHDAARTAAWAEARRGARVIVGGRTSVLAPVPDLAAVIVLDDGDEALQEERAPTWHARDVGAERAERAGAGFATVTPVPTLESLQLAGPSAPTTPEPAVARAGWGVLDVVDLRDEPPGTGLLSEAFAAALHRTVDRGERAVCVVNRRGRARLLACRTCGELARCAVCDAAVAQPDRELVCPRCGATRPTVCLNCHGSTFRTVRPGISRLRDEVAGLVPRVEVAEVDARTDVVPDVPVLVGTEAVLHRVAGKRPSRSGYPAEKRAGPERPGAQRQEREVGLVAFLEFDQELLAPRVRAAEQALWLLARAARLVGGRRGGRVLVQTRVPGHEVLQAASTGRLADLLTVETACRRALGYPPFGGVAEVSGDDAAVAAACASLRDAVVEGVQVLGPSGARALVQAPSVSALADALEGADLARARALGRLRVAVDPPRI